MFTTLKKLFGQGRLESEEPTRFDDPISQWAGTQGYSVTSFGKDFSISGRISSKAWTLARGRSTRDFIVGDELRAHADLGIDPSVTVLIINRPLKGKLEQAATQSQAQTQTTRTPEMHCLANHSQVQWDALPSTFWSRYAVYADDRKCAMAWLDANLTNLLMHWPDAKTDALVPFMLMITNGQATLRMQYTPADLATLEHAATVYTSACESALMGLCEYMAY